MQLRIAAGQPADVAVLGWWLIGERRKGDDLRTRFAPRREQMGVDEGERRVRGERNALARWRQCPNRAECSRFDRPRAGNDGFEIDVTFGHVCESIDPLSQVLMLACLDEAQMPFWQNDFLAR